MKRSTGLKPDASMRLLGLSSQLARLPLASQINESVLVLQGQLRAPSTVAQTLPSESDSRGKDRPGTHPGIFPGAEGVETGVDPSP